MEPRNRKVAMLAKDVIRELSPEMQELAERMGVSYSSFKYWKTGDRTPSAENAEKLAELADAQADKLIALAARLRREASESER